MTIAYYLQLRQGTEMRCPSVQWRTHEAGIAQINGGAVGCAPICSCAGRGLLVKPRDDCGVDKYGAVGYADKYVTGKYVTVDHADQ